MFKPSQFKSTPDQPVGTFSSPPKVYNKHHKNAPADAIYIGRPSKWGNPYSHLPNGTLAEFIVGSRDEAVDGYKVWVRSQPELVAAIKKELKGKSVICWCAPHRCHGDVLIEIANE